MKISVNALRFLNEYYGSAGDPAPDGVDALVQKIGAQLGAVEETIAFGKRLEQVVIVTIVSCEDHPDSDHLHICKVDDGGVVQQVERDEQGLVQIVTGAPNVRDGFVAAWLPPGSTVPETFDKDPFVLESRSLRGKMSHGMLASARELGLGDDHSGILEIDDELGPIQPGTPFVDAFHVRDDVIIDMENKMFTHRPDCFGWLGIAREIEGISGRPYKSPQWYRPDASIPGPEAEELKLEVRNELPELVPRFAAVALRDVTVKPSPVWLRIDLARAGLRSINNIVDYTNWYMLLTGQPLHAYDYDKVKALSEGGQATIVVRHPRQGEKIKLLNGKEIEPRGEAIMIATDKQLIGVGGVMGGGETEVDETTQNIIIECATFDMYSIRRTSMAHGLFTDAVTRFNKGQSPLQNVAVLGKIVGQVRDHAGGKVASPLIDDNHVPQDVRDRASVHPPVSVSRQFINARLGFDLSAEEMKTLLTNVECKVEVEGDELTVTAPFWRTDIEISEDVVEEVGRLYGYDKLPLELPRRGIAPAHKNALLELKTRIRNCLAACGANELLTYSFVHGNLLDKAGQDRAQAFQLGNALSPDLQYFRLSLTPSLLDKVHPNLKAGHDRFALFEIGKAHIVGAQDGEGLPKEFERVALVFAADKKAAETYAGAPYYEAKEYLTQLLHKLGVTAPVCYEPLGQSDTDQAATYYAAGRAATIKVGDIMLGRVGEYKPAVRKALKLPDFCAGFELGLESFLQIIPAHAAYQPLPRFPSLTQDMCLKVPAGTSYAQVYDFIEAHLAQYRPDQTHHTLAPVDIYQRNDDPAHKQITLRLCLASFERTLTDTEVAKLLDDAAAAAKTELQAERV